MEELLAAHLKQARDVQAAAGNSGWFDAALEEVIALLKDDYPTLMRVLSAVDEVELAQDRHGELNGRLA